MTTATSSGTIVNGVAGYYYSVVGLGNLNSSGNATVAWYTNGVATGVTNLVGYLQINTGIYNGAGTITSRTIYQAVGTTNTWKFLSGNPTIVSNSFFGLYQR